MITFVVPTWLAYVFIVLCGIHAIASTAKSFANARLTGIKTKQLKQEIKQLVTKTKEIEQETDRLEKLKAKLEKEKQ